MSETPAPPSPRRLPHAPTAAFAGALVLGAIAAQLGTVAFASVDVPFLDDWDVVVGFQVYWETAESWASRVRLLFDPHNEHLLALPRTAVLLVNTLRGHIDFRWLNLLGNACGLALLLALWRSFRPADPVARRLTAFAPAVLCLAQPQAWTAVLSPTVSLSNLGVLALAAGCFATLAGDGRARVARAAACAMAACFCSANGVLVGPLASAVPWLRGERRLAALWLGTALVGLAIYLASAPGDHAASDPLASLTHPGRLAVYGLHFVGAAGGFARPLGSLLVGASLCVSFCVLALRGAPRRSPVVMTLAAFVLASIAANALLRAHQGADAPLFQPRYAIYGAVLLALTHLAWVDTLSSVAQRRYLTTALVAAVAFWSVAFATGGSAARARAAGLEAGLATWWETGREGLQHPDPRKAAFFLREAIDADLLRLPASFEAAYGVTPRATALPVARARVRGGLDAVQQRVGWLVVLGRAQLAGSTGSQPVELVLANGAQAFVAPARSVAAPERGDARARQPPPRPETGYHALLDTRDLPSGSYRLGVVVKLGERRHFAWTGTEIGLPVTR